MQRNQVILLLALALTPLGSACTGDEAEKRTPPDAPVQGGEALQVEVDPAATDTPTVGSPGATLPSRDSP